LCVDVLEGPAPVYYFENRPYLRVGTQSVIAQPNQVEHLVYIGNLSSEMRKQAAEMAGLKTELHPSGHVAASIIGQGELATMEYSDVRDRLMSELMELLPGLKKGI
jgi:hypothetical protein